MLKVKSERMGGYASTEVNESKLYYPYDKLVSALGLTNYELDEYNRPVCLSNINHNFLYVAKLLYLTLCEENGYHAKLEPELKRELLPFDLLLVMIAHARTAEFSQEKILSILQCKEIPKEQMFLRFQSHDTKIYVLEYGIMCRPEVCAWRHPYLPVGSLIPNLSGTLKMITGLDSLEHAVTISDTLLNLEGKTRYYDVSTLKYRNGTDKAIRYDTRYRIMCSSEVQHYHFFVAMLTYREVMKSFEKWLKVLSSKETTEEPLFVTPVTPVAPVQSKKKGKEPLVESKSNKRQNITKATRDRVWRRHSNTFSGECWVCGDPIRYENWHCAHIISDADGGLPNEDNLVPACPPCNQSMKDMHMYDYMYLYHTDRLKRLGWTKEFCPIIVK